MFRIRQAAQMAGITPALLRAWERRYGLLPPRRTASGYRLYSTEDIAALRAVARLVAAGQSIGEVARLPLEEIRATAAALGGGPGLAGPAVPVSQESIDGAIQGALAAIGRFDRDRFEAALSAVLGLESLPPVAACERLLLPMLRAIGDAWERGGLSVSAEHFGSALVRARILQWLHAMPRLVEGRRLVCACPDGEQHEGGLLAFAVHGAASGWEVIYLGASTPLGEALDTARRLRAHLLALSLTVQSEVEVAAIAGHVLEYVRAHGCPRVVAGGRAALAHRTTVQAAGIAVANEIRVDLEGLCGPAPQKIAGD
jgi:DNA-binding transcriptional MerR regulator/methylmalonyl-CoA mutase cobalamin-binding subunit